jgi:hypothetical protein
MKSLTKPFLICAFMVSAPLCAQETAEEDVVEQDASEQSPESKMWKDSLDWQGDFRLRYEAIDEQGEAERNRFRFRGRFGLASQVTENLQFTVRIATSNGDPVSTNLTFGDGFSTKDIAIDRAFFNWNVVGGLDVAFGKMSNPWFRAGGNSLLWDGDLNPEGIVANWQSLSGPFFANLGTFAVAERSSGDNSWLNAVQAGINFRLSETSRLRFAGSFFAYTNTIGNQPFYEGRAKGNSVDANGNFIYDYETVEISTEYGVVINGWPTSFFGVWAQNTAVDEADTALALGVRIGSTNVRGDAQFSYAWHDTEADAVMGIFSDSDFGGGETDSKGHFIKAKYALRARIILAATFIISEIGEFRDDRHDYDRLQLDVEYLFQ